MKGRYINFNLFLFLVLAPFSVFGFSIGDIEVDSTLNEKLNGEIPFHLRLNEKPSDIYVKVASPDIYKQQNIAWQNVLNSVNFKRVGTSITFTSKSKVTKPVLDLLVEINSGSEKKIRHYKIVLSGQVSRNRVSTNIIKALKLEPNLKKPDIQAPSTLTLEAGLHARLIGDNEIGPIKKDDTISRVSHYLGKYFGVSAKKMQASLINNNPDAFSDRKHTKLITGAYLKIPSVDSLSVSDNPIQKLKYSNDKSVIIDKSVIAPTVLVPDSVVNGVLEKAPLAISPLVEQKVEDINQLQSRIAQLERTVDELKIEANALSQQQQISVRQKIPTPILPNTNPLVLSEKHERVGVNSIDNIKPPKAGLIKEQKLPFPKKKSSIYMPFISVFAFISLCLAGWIYMKKIRVKSKHSRMSSHTGILDELYPVGKELINSKDDFDINIIDLELSSKENFIIDDIELHASNKPKNHEDMSTMKEIIP